MSATTVKIFRWFNGVLQTLEKAFLTEEEALEFSLNYADRHEGQETKVYDKDGQLLEHRRHHHKHHEHGGPYDQETDELGIPPFRF